MKQNNYNTTALHVYIANNGDRLAKQAICKASLITEASLNRILRGGSTRWEVRYRIYVFTGIKLLDGDNFPSLAPKEAS